MTSSSALLDADRPLPQQDEGAPSPNEPIEVKVRWAKKAVSALHQHQAAPKPREAFEKKVRWAKNAALRVSFFHQLSRFFGLCALTWATVVLLGGFAASLRTLDFLLVSSLLLLESIRLFIVQLFSKIVSKTRFREGHRPENFEFKDKQFTKANLFDNIGQVMSLLLAFTSLVSAIVRFILTRKGYGLSGNNSDNGSNLGHALYIFYVLVMGNSFLAILSGLLRPWLRRRCDGRPSDKNPNTQNCLLAFLSGLRCRPSDKNPITQNCLMAFHDEIYKIAIDVGFPEADQLDILEFAYTKLSIDYKRNIRPPLIKSQNKDLISYLYLNQQGIAMTCEYLSSPDVWKQVVAANLPGFWAEEEKIESQVALFWALRRKMYGAGKDAESALNSIEALGKKWAAMSKPHPFLINAPDSATNIVDTLVQLLVKPIRPNLLFQLRAFEACCRNSQVVRHMYGGQSPQGAQEMCQKLQNMIAGGEQEESEARPARLQELCRKLFENVRETGIRATTKIYAVSALLYLLCYGTGNVGEEAMEVLRGPVQEFLDPAKEAGRNGGKPSYSWMEEVVLVTIIRGKVRLPMYEAEQWKGVPIRSPDGTKLSLETAQEECARALQALAFSSSS